MTNQGQVNDRKECASIDLLAGGTVLEVGDERLYISPCNVVRATVTTKTGSLNSHIKDCNFRHLSQYRFAI